jgi:DNA repair protein RadC
MESGRLTLKRLAEEDRPREKLLQKGKSALSEAELLAILMGSGNREQTAVELAQILLNHCENSLHQLAGLSIKDLQKFKGIGEAKAITIVAALEIGRRRKEQDPIKKPIISNAADVFELIKSDLMDLQQEEFWVILLKRNNEVIKKELISRGGVSGTLVDTKIIFKRALEETACNLIIAHNHPSGNLKPSHEDVRLTKKIKEAGKTLDISVLDHLIVTNHGFYSFSDQGIMPS